MTARRDMQWKPLSNLMSHSTTIYIKVMNPRPISLDPLLTIKEACALLIADDRDFPLMDFNVDKQQWIVSPGTIGHDPKTKDTCIVWLQATQSVSTIVRFFRQCGWEVTFTHWAGYD